MVLVLALELNFKLIVFFNKHLIFLISLLSAFSHDFKIPGNFFFAFFEIVFVIFLFFIFVLQLFFVTLQVLTKLFPQVFSVVCQSCIGLML